MRWMYLLVFAVTFIWLRHFFCCLNPGRALWLCVWDKSDILKLLSRKCKDLGKSLMLLFGTILTSRLFEVINPMVCLKLCKWILTQNYAYTEETSSLKYLEWTYFFLSPVNSNVFSCGSTKRILSGGSFLNGNPHYWHSFQLFAESCNILLSDHRKSISFQSYTLGVMSWVDERILSEVQFKDGMYNNVCC